MKDGDPAAAFLGRVIDPYRILDAVGRCGMGVVLRARQESMGREVSVKRMLAGDSSTGHA